MPSAFITGVATGLGRDMALGLARAGFALTLVDVDSHGLQTTAAEIERVTGIRPAYEMLDVCDTERQHTIVEQHVARHGGMDLAVLNAGIGERGELFDPTNNKWQKTVDVDLTAVLTGARSCVLQMQRQSQGGTVICIASAAGLYPMPVCPVYAAAKGGVVHFVRSAGPTVAKNNIRLMAICPEFVDTPLVQRMLKEDQKMAKRVLGRLDIKLLQPAAVTSLMMQLINAPDTHKSGTVAMLRQDGSIQFPFQGKPVKGVGAAITPTLPPPTPAATSAALLSWARANLPTTYRKLQVRKLSSDFRSVTHIVESALPATPPPGQLLLKRVWAGINASDINFTAGRYFGSIKEAEGKLPFDCGFESVNVVVAVGSGVQGIKPGDCCACLTYDSFSEFGLLPASKALVVSSPAPEVVACLTSGLTASLALEQCGNLQPGQVVLVTAAAGGTGQFAVQLARLAGCHVVATAGGPDKVALLKRLGAHRVIDYKTEKLKAVLRAEYPKGVDVIYESVGGDFFNTSVDALAQGGRIIIIGMMSSYQEGWPLSSTPGLPEKLLWKSASVHGFFLLRYAKLWKQHLSRLIALASSGALVVSLDNKSFVGVEKVADAVEHLQSGASMGKVVVQMWNSLPPGGDRLAVHQAAASKL